MLKEYEKLVEKSTLLNIILYKIYKKNKIKNKLRSAEYYFDKIAKTHIFLGKEDGCFFI